MAFFQIGVQIRRFDFSAHIKSPDFTLVIDRCEKCTSYGVKVPSTSSLSVYTKVLAHNLNDIRNWASLIGLLFRMLVFAFNLFNLLLR